MAQPHFANGIQVPLFEKVDEIHSQLRAITDMSAMTQAIRQQPAAKTGYKVCLKGVIKERNLTL